MQKRETGRAPLPRVIGANAEGATRQDGPLSTIQLFGCSLRRHIDRHVFAAKLAIVKSDAAFA